MGTPRTATSRTGTTPTMAELAAVQAEWRGVRDWTRTIWASPEAKEVWAPRFSRVSRAWAEAERRSVLEGVREGALLSVPPDQLPQQTRRAAASGLVLLPLGRLAASGSYSAAARSPEAGEDWTWRTALTRPELSSEWYGAWERSDDEAIGRLLGFPECCRRFFCETWGEKIDTTWWMVDAEERWTVVQIWHDPRNNILLRWLGLRAVPHLPCSFDCEPTREVADKMLPLLPEAERAWLLEALGWPVEWSGLHGIAEIKTPVVKVSARTDWTPEKRVVRLLSETYPAEGARGNVFPYLGAREKRDKLVQLQKAETAQNGARDVGGPSRGTTLRTEGDARDATSGPHLWTDNGFASAQAMALAHRPIVELARRHASAGPVCDLGCGNGELLRRIGLPAVGVEKDSARAARAVPDVEVREGDFLERPELWPGPYELVILMPGRLVEAGEVDRVRELVCERADHLLLYCYGDWLERYGSIERLVEAAWPELSACRIDGAREADVEAALYLVGERGR